MKTKTTTKKPDANSNKGHVAPNPKPDEITVSGLMFTAETLDRLIAEAQYQQHPYGKVWQRFDLDALTVLAGNIDRRGLDQEIVLYQGMILEGWHRYLACLATKTTPKFSEFKGTDLEAAERVHASGVRRQSTPDQRYASFVLLCEACPAFKEKYEQLKEKGIQQQQAGTPLSSDTQRVDVVAAKAAAAGVSRSTAAKVERVKKQKPEAVADIAAGTTSANKVLTKTKKEKRPGQPGNTDETALGTLEIGTSGDVATAHAPAFRSVSAVDRQRKLLVCRSWDRRAKDAVARGIAVLVLPELEEGCRP